MSPIVFHPRIVPGYAEIESAVGFPQVLTCLVLEYLGLLQNYRNFWATFSKLEPEKRSLQRFTEIFLEGRCFANLKLSQTVGSRDDQTCFLDMFRCMAETQSEKEKYFSLKQRHIGEALPLSLCVSSSVTSVTTITPYNNMIQVWEINQKEPKVVASHTHAGFCVKSSEDGTLFVTGARLLTDEPLKLFCKKLPDGQESELEPPQEFGFWASNYDFFISGDRVFVFQIRKESILDIIGFATHEKTYKQSFKHQIGTAITRFDRCCFQPDTGRFYHFERSQANPEVHRLKAFDCEIQKEIDLGFESYIYATTVQGNIIAVANWDPVSGYRIHVWDLKRNKDDFICIIELNRPDDRDPHLRIKLLGDKLFVGQDYMTYQYTLSTYKSLVTSSSVV